MTANKAAVLKAIQTALREMNSAGPTFSNEYGPGVESKGRFHVVALRSEWGIDYLTVDVVPGCTKPPRDRQDLDKATEELASAISKELLKACCGGVREDFHREPGKPGVWRVSVAWDPAEVRG